MALDDLWPMAAALRRVMEMTLWLGHIEAQCVPASLLAAPIVRAAAPALDWSVAWGAGHCWIESAEGHVVDLTHAQYGDPSVVVMNPYEAAASRYVAEILLERAEEAELREGIVFTERAFRHHDQRFKTSGPLLTPLLMRERIKTR